VPLTSFWIILPLVLAVRRLAVHRARLVRVARCSSIASMEEAAASVGATGGPFPSATSPCR